MALRARAYLADAEGRPAEAIAILERAEGVASAARRPIDAAVARAQRGKRLGGDEGAALLRRSRADLAALGAGERLLEEDAALR
jgi:hypothetical protein